MCSGVSFPRKYCENYLSLPSSAKVKNDWSCASIHRTCLHAAHKDNFTLYFPLFLYNNCKLLMTVYGCT